jgi:protein-L-isoaspartate(D-aspartate) O-methyltransferase
MPGDAAALNADLVASLVARGLISQPAVEAAFRAVPRHIFLPTTPVEEAYRDEAIATKFEHGRPVSSSSQPAIMAIMLEQLEPQPGQRVLEIGAGTGYNAALLARLVGSGGQVVTVDIDEDIAHAASHHLAQAGIENVLVVCGDGGLGYPPQAPYDRIILTVGAWDIAPAWLEQLSPAGRLVLPLALGAGLQSSIAFERPAAAPGGPLLVSRSVRECGFMRLRGAFAGPEFHLSLGPSPGLTLGLAGPLPVVPETIYRWLEQPYTDFPVGLQLSRKDVWHGLVFWLGLEAGGYCDVSVEGELLQQLSIPCLFQFGTKSRMCFTLGLLAGDGLCLLGMQAPPEAGPDDTPSELLARGFGPGAAGLAAQLVDRAQAWQAAGQPGASALRVRAFAAGATYDPAPGEVVVDKRYTRLVVDWPPADV